MERNGPLGAIEGYANVVGESLTHSKADAVLGLEIGADDYIIKSALRSRELVSRLRAVTRRKQFSREESAVLGCQQLRVVLAERRVFVGEQLINLRPKEFDMLACLLKRKNHVMSRDQLAELVWGYGYFPTSRAIDITVARLRTKLGAYGDHIESVKNIGYRFSE